jgi:putative phosphoesterase
MRILVVSDIHANHEALRRVPDQADRVICLGDLVDYGPEPKPCIDWVRERANVVVRGNHDHAVATRESCRCSPSVRRLSEATRELMWQLLGEEDVAWLANLPLEADVNLGGVRFHIVHATPSDPLYAYLSAAETDRWQAELERIDADVILVGHTHMPAVLRFGKKLVVNPGSVGQPGDGDPRAAFAVIEDGEPRLERVEYDVEAAVSALRRTDLAEDILNPLARILRSGGRRT